MRAEEPRRVADEFFERLFAQDVPEVGLAAHPPDEALRAYLRGRLQRSWPEPDEVSGQERLTEWTQQVVSMHVLACPRCQEQLRSLQTARHTALWGALSRRGEHVFRWLRRMPRPALATMTVQSLVIVALAGLLFLQPAPLRSTDLAVGSEPLAIAPSEEQALTPTIPPAPEGEEALPPLAVQAIETLTRSPDPQTRLAALQRLQQYPDPSLVEPLTQVYEYESHPEVRQAVARTITQIVSRTETKYTRMWRAIQRIRRTGDEPFAAFEQISQQLERLMSDVYELQEQQRYPRALYCSGPQELTLGQLGQILLQVEGQLVFDRSFPAKGFQVRVPYREGIEQTLERLKSQFRLVCRKE